MGARRTAMWAAAMVGLACGRRRAARPSRPRRGCSIVIVVDGLRPDMVTARQMPRLDRIAARGVEFTAHHAVFPTVTRVNAATFVTGVLPARHGLLGNTIYIPSVDPVKTIDTADHEALLGVAARDRSLLAAPTLGQILGARRQAPAGGELGLAGVGAAAQSRPRRRGDPADGVRAARRVAGQERGDARPDARRRTAQRRPQPLRDRSAAAHRPARGAARRRVRVVQRPRHDRARPRPRRSGDRASRCSSSTPRSDGSRTGCATRAGSRRPTSWSPPTTASRPTRADSTWRRLVKPFVRHVARRHARHRDGGRRGALSRSARRGARDRNRRGAAEAAGGRRDLHARQGRRATWPAT